MYYLGLESWLSKLRREESKLLGTLPKCNRSVTLEVKGDTRGGDSGGPDNEVFTETSTPPPPYRGPPSQLSGHFTRKEKPQLP